MIAVSGFHELAGEGITLSSAVVPTGTDRMTCAVRLIDRRTGASHRINGRPLTFITRQPHLAVAALLEGRDASVWEARIEPLGPEAAP
jgi:hypothetical protein